MPTDHFRGVAKNQASLFRTHPTQIQIRCQPTAEGIPAPPRQVSVLNLLADFIFCTAQVDSFPPIREQPDQRRDHWVPTTVTVCTSQLNSICCWQSWLAFISSCG